MSQSRHHSKASSRGMFKFKLVINYDYVDIFQVGDVNDCDVEFAQAQWEVKLREDGKLSHDVIEALDEDDPKEAAFYFYLKGDGKTTGLCTGVSVRSGVHACMHVKS